MNKVKVAFWHDWLSGFSEVEEGEEFCRVVEVPEDVWMEYRKASQEYCKNLKKMLSYYEEK